MKILSKMFLLSSLFSIPLMASHNEEYNFWHNDPFLCQQNNSFFDSELSPYTSNNLNPEEEDFWNMDTNVSEPIFNPLPSPFAYAHNGPILHDQSSSLSTEPLPDLFHPYENTTSPLTWTPEDFLTDDHSTWGPLPQGRPFPRRYMLDIEKNTCIDNVMETTTPTETIPSIVAHKPSRTQMRQQIVSGCQERYNNLTLKDKRGPEGDLLLQQMEIMIVDLRGADKYALMSLAIDLCLAQKRKQDALDYAHSLVNLSKKTLIHFDFLQKARHVIKKHNQ